MNAPESRRRNKQKQNEEESGRGPPGKDAVIASAYVTLPPHLYAPNVTYKCIFLFRLLQKYGYRTHDHSGKALESTGALISIRLSGRLGNNCEALRPDLNLIAAKPCFCATRITDFLACITVIRFVVHSLCARRAEAAPISSKFRGKDECSLMFTCIWKSPCGSFSAKVGIFGSSAGQIPCRLGALVLATEINKVHRNKCPIAAIMGISFFRAVYKVCRTEEAAIPATRLDKRGSGL